MARAITDGESELVGVLTRAGHSYAAKGTAELRAVAEQERSGVVAAAERLRPGRSESMAGGFRMIGHQPHIGNSGKLFCECGGGSGAGADTRASKPRLTHACASGRTMLALPPPLTTAIMYWKKAAWSRNGSG